VVEDPLRLPNWRLSICSPTSSIIQETTKSSKTLDKIAVQEIGPVSLSQRDCFTFGMGVMLEHFHRMGTSPVESDVLKITKTSRKSSIEEKLFWKVALSPALIFSTKDICTINVTFFYLYLHLNPCVKCFFFRRWVA